MRATRPNTPSGHHISNGGIHAAVDIGEAVLAGELADELDRAALLRDVGIGG